MSYCVKAASADERFFFFFYCWYAFGVCSKSCDEYFSICTILKNKMTGAVTELIAVGALDTYLTQQASFTWWKSRYNKHTQFAMESVKQMFNTAVSFGTESQLTLNRQGDLVYFLYVLIELPGIVACDGSKESGCAGLSGGNQFPTYMDQSCAPCNRNDENAYADYMDNDGASSMDSGDRAAKMKSAKDKWLKERYGHGTTLECCDDVEDCPDNLCPELGNVWCHWTNDVGQFLIKEAKIVIGGSVVDKIQNDFLFMWEELSGKSGRRLTEMVGKRYTRTQLVCDSRQKRLLYVPLPFWFSQHSGQALALAALQFHGVQLHMEWERLERCVVVSSKDVIVKNVETSTTLTANDLVAYLETTYVYLENAERERFATNHFEVLITQHQSFSMQATNNQPRIQLNFNHPVIELLFAVRRQCQERCNNWFNYSGIDNRDPITHVELFLNNQSRFSKKPGVYFRTVQPYQHHSNIPDAFIYVFSFALHPEDVSPSGTCNMSRIDHVDLNLTLQDGLNKEQVSVLIFARSFNVIRYREGLAGLAFAN